MINLSIMHNPRFYSYLSLFTFFMLVLISGDNLLIIFIGWEGVGVCSYILVNFWYKRIQANKAAMKALIVNRIGDCGLSLGMILMWWIFGNLELSTIFSLAPLINVDLITMVTILVLLGAMAKSAQLGLLVEAHNLNWRTSQPLKLNPSRYAGSSYLTDSNGDEGSNGWDNLQGTEDINKIPHWDKDWFVGFVEGDGSFYISQGKCCFSIHLHIVDLALLHMIQNELKMGNIYLNKKSALFQVKKKSDIEILIGIFNGKIFLNKRQDQFARWVNYYNSKYGTNFILKKRVENPTFNDAW